MNVEAFLCCSVTDHHTDGRQTPASPVHHVKEEETCHRDEVRFWKKKEAVVKTQRRPQTTLLKTKLHFWQWIPVLIQSLSAARIKTPKHFGVLVLHTRSWESKLTTTSVLHVTDRAANFPELHCKPPEKSFPLRRYWKHEHISAFCRLLRLWCFQFKLK